MKETPSALRSPTHHRRSIRLKNYEYTNAGAYFVTICTRNRECLFGDVVGSEMVLNESGRIVQDEWLQTENVRPHVELDAFVVMPNHLHAIIVLTAVVGATRRVAPTKCLSPNGSTSNAASLDYLRGSAIIMNTLSATNRN